MHAKELMRVLTSLSYPESTWDQPPSYLPKNLEAGAEVFLRNETGSGTFDCRFTGPYLLIAKDKSMKLFLRMEETLSCPWTV